MGAYEFQFYTLTVSLPGTGSGSVSGSGISCGIDCTESYADGTLVTLTASAATGSSFAGWSGACTNISGECVVTMDAAKSVTANFTLNQYALTVSLAGSGSVSSAPAGIDCGTVCSGTYDYGTLVTLTATPSTGSTFAGWSGGGCDGTGTCVVTMDAAVNVTATFDLVPPGEYALSVSLAGDGAGTVTGTGINCFAGAGADCSGTYTDGTTVTLTAAAGTGSTFEGWSGACTNATGECAVVMTEARTVTATFDLSLPIPPTGPFVVFLPFTVR